MALLGNENISKAVIVFSLFVTKYRGTSENMANFTSQSTRQTFYHRAQRNERQHGKLFVTEYRGTNDNIENSVTEYRGTSDNVANFCYRV